ncbi:alpha/beta hydrolase-fold protein [Paludisphaera mucosa]|uniref:Alpha/beta hydrolase-fold protein n=1 Tax=Paludisphaera mucosa TaxID=3030827 RepID=A0ABT6F6V8_9BACT|nr:alpha/beta hydrolase-fold protein [Paludisphaera mucosa]MDG3003331.1 alpha/beta hydrolase-fold protein [Paludisphaera mucosa]
MMRRSARLGFVLRVFGLGVVACGVSSAEETPKGEVQKHVFEASTIFPGTTRDYWIYLPKQYDASKPAALFVCQDGVQYDAPAVFDELIARREVPVLIGVFVMHGRVKATSDGALDRFNRSYEYDGLGDAYARFLIEELLPEVEKQKTADGRPIRITRSPDERAIAGSSSGAVCAFTAAWERPDSFRRVFSGIGTYVGLRGGNVYPTLIRKYEPRPLRVFMEDGADDLNIYGGDWWMANQEMERALTFAGYEVAHAWGEGGHSSKHATEIFADAMRWLWKDWTVPIKPGPGAEKLREIVVPGEGWSVAAAGVNASSMTVDPAGDVYVSDAAASRIQKISADGRVESVSDRPDKVVDALLGRLTRHDGARFVPFPGPGETSTSGRQIEARSPTGAAVVSNTALPEAGSLVLSPDQSLMYIADAASRWVYSYQVQPDLSLQFGQKYHHLHVGDDARDAGTSGLAVDRDGRLYAATALGVQVCDQAGRVNVILPTPRGAATSLSFGGPNFDVLYVGTGTGVYKRKVKTRGANAFDPPRKPEAPRL